MRAEASDHKSPPFAKKREGWGTLKFQCLVALEEEPRTHNKPRRVAHPASCKSQVKLAGSAVRIFPG